MLLEYAQSQSERDLHGGELIVCRHVGDRVATNESVARECNALGGGLCGCRLSPAYVAQVKGSFLVAWEARPVLPNVCKIDNWHLKEIDVLVSMYPIVAEAR